MEILLQLIDELKNGADALKPYKEEYEQNFWRKFRLEFNYNSNHLEGSTLTYGHTQLLLMFDKVGSDSYTLRELEEMKAHDVALRLVKEAAQDPNNLLTEKFIKEINQTILVRPFYKEAETFDGQPTRRLIEPGQYKKHPNNVRLENGEIFHYASVAETPALMGDFIEWIRTEEQKKELHPVQLAALVHYKFVRIHPFDDSNGRTSRLLMNYFLLRYGYAPIVINSSDKKNYLAALNRADSGDINSFVNYIINQAIRWQQTYTKAIKGESVEDVDDVDKEIKLLKHRIDYTQEKEKVLSNQVLKKTYHNSIEPFLIRIIERMSTFDSYFLRKEVTFSGVGSGVINEVENSFRQYVEHIVENMVISPFTWKFSIIHRNLSKTRNVSFSYTTNFEINFTKTYYEVKYPQKPDISFKKLYHQVISENEIEDFARILLKDELNAIKIELGDL
ncbi:MAG: Fic family protein [Chitinophagaceae bacterium]|nr:Fic family protein [Chitinophagaceae bacterium]